MRHRSSATHSIPKSFIFRRLRETAIGTCGPGTGLARHPIARAKKSSLSLKEMQMSKLLSTLIAGTFTIGSAHALADGLVDSQKQAHLDRIFPYANASAPARGKPLVDPALAPT